MQPDKKFRQRPQAERATHHEPSQKMISGLGDSPLRFLPSRARVFHLMIGTPRFPFVTGEPRPDPAGALYPTLAVGGVSFSAGYQVPIRAKHDGENWMALSDHRRGSWVSLTEARHAIVVDEIRHKGVAYRWGLRRQVDTARLQSRQFWGFHGAIIDTPPAAPRRRASR